MGGDKEVHIGEQVRYYRRMRKLSQEDLALMAGINPAFVGHIERGIKSPTVNTLIKITQALDISLAQLFTLRESEEQTTRQREEDLARISLELQNLSDEDVSSMAQIVGEIVKLKQT